MTAGETETSYLYPPKLSGSDPGKGSDPTLANTKQFRSVNK